MTLSNDRYWDWVLDWEDVTKAPVWDHEFGFGGNGNASIGEPILKGYCVDNGPFAMLGVPYFDTRIERHCLLRGFENGTALEDISQNLRPQVLENLMMVSDFEAFNLGLEHGPHDAIPHSIRGDFSLFTAPFGMKSCEFKDWSDIRARSCLLPSSHTAGSSLVDVATKGRKEP